ncbi:MAG: hypothetical protein QM754_04700 [Tepidisphaeraceae bacterium]
MKHPSIRMHISGNMDVDSPEATLKKLKLDRSVAPVPKFFTGGENAAHQAACGFHPTQAGRLRREPQ